VETFSIFPCNFNHRCNSFHVNCQDLSCVHRDIQCGNFNWNKIHNLDIGGFCKKSRNMSIFVFSCTHFGAYGFSISAPGSSEPPLTFFFKWKGTPSHTSFENPPQGIQRNIYFLNIFKAYVLKNKNQFYKLNSI
jgi:hypothetical protein